MGTDGRFTADAIGAIQEEAEAHLVARLKGEYYPNLCPNHL